MTTSTSSDTYLMIAIIITAQMECQGYLFTHHPPFSIILTLDFMIVSCSVLSLLPDPCHKQTNNLPFVPVQGICIQQKPVQTLLSS